jgi:hypothetical protein
MRRNALTDKKGSKVVGEVVAVVSPYIINLMSFSNMPVI